MSARSRPVDATVTIITSVYPRGDFSSWSVVKHWRRPHGYAGFGDIARLKDPAWFSSDARYAHLEDDVTLAPADLPVPGRSGGPIYKDPFHDTLDAIHARVRAMGPCPRCGGERTSATHGDAVACPKDCIDHGTPMNELHLAEVYCVTDCRGGVRAAPTQDAEDGEDEPADDEDEPDRANPPARDSAQRTLTSFG